MSRALVLFFLTTRAFALDPSDIHTVAVYDKPKRMTIEKYGEITKGLGREGALKRFAPTGVIRCGDRQASAQITGARNIVTTSDHIFFDRKTCRRKVDPEDCTLNLRTSKGWRKYDVERKLAGGFKCQNGEDQAWGDDWAVLKLEKDVPKEIEPYKIPMAGDVHQDEIENVIAVAGASKDFFFVKPDGEKVHPRNIQNCEVRFVRDVSGDGSYVETTCDNAILASGGSLLRPSPTGDGDTLIGIHMGSFELNDMLEKALEEGRTNTAPFKQGSWSAIYTSVDGVFLRALMSAINPEMAFLRALTSASSQDI